VSPIEKELEGENYLSPSEKESAALARSQFLRGVTVSCELQEVLVDRWIGREFRVKCSRENTAILDQDGSPLVFSENCNSLSNFLDDRAADEDHLERLFGERARAEEHIASELAAIAIAENGHVEEVEGILRGILDLRGEKNRARACAEDGVVFREFAYGVVQTLFLEKLQLRGGLTTRKDETIAAIQVSNGTDLYGLGAEFAKPGSVSFEVTLDGQDADFGLSREGHGTYPFSVISNRNR